MYTCKNQRFLNKIYENNFEFSYFKQKFLSKYLFFNSIIILQRFL